MTKRSRRRSYRRDPSYGAHARGSALVEDQLRQESGFSFSEWLDIEITSDDEKNYFGVKVTFPDIQGTSFLASSYNVYGRQTVSDLGKVVAHRLWLEDKVMSPHSTPALYRSDDKLLAQDLLLASILKETKREDLGDGVTLKLKCRINGVWGAAYGY